MNPVTSLSWGVVPEAGARPAAPAFDLGIGELSRSMPVMRCKLAAGECLYRVGQPFRALFLVNTGSLKTCELADDGREQVSAFHMRGDLVGLESIGLEAYACDVIALESGEVWELPYLRMLAACGRMPEWQVRLASALAGEIRRERLWMLALGTLSAEQRVAAFLLDLAARHARLGFSPHHFLLRMGRLDMASFLALQHETVSRALSRLVELGLVTIERREVDIADVDGLHALVGRTNIDACAPSGRHEELPARRRGGAHRRLSARSASGQRPTRCADAPRTDSRPHAPT